MRPIITLPALPQAEQLVTYLKAQGIDCEIEVVKNTDWGNAAYGDAAYRLWVYDEHLLEKSLAIATHFQQGSLQAAAPLQSALPQHKGQRASGKTKRVSRDTAPLTGITLAVLLICSLLFIATALDSSEYSALPFLYAPLKKQLLFDYPHTFELLEQFIASFGIEALKSTEQLPSSALALIQKLNQTPYWKGFYEVVVEYLQTGQWNLAAPLFEKIRQGEVWRLFSPALLHADIFHILFNMLWLVVLGKQLEFRMGAWRFLAFLLLSAGFSNVAQYLAGGYQFLGISGVLCAMLAFVWMRQRRAAWEGYFLQPSSLNFMLAFLGLMLLLQTISFYTEVAFQTSIAPPIANTAHMSGLLIGAFLGRLDFFAAKT